MPPRSSRTYHDPLHGAITLSAHDPAEALLIQLIDTPSFQRLRRIRQLGIAHLTFHGAEGSRFTHSLGVMHVARMILDRLAQTDPSLQTQRAQVLCAALLHDIGHGPLSHTCEDLFNSQHEYWTREILRLDPVVRGLLDAFHPQLATDLEEIYCYDYQLPWVSQLVSSQLDCDRIDYLMRDSYFTGASYGNLDLDRILMALTYDPAQEQLVVAEKGQAAIEHYLVVRYFMYAQVYNHPKNVAATWGLQQIIQCAKRLHATGNVFADDIMARWLTQPPDAWPLHTYLEADDTWLTYHIHRWQHHDDRVLNDLCRRYLDRDLFKAFDVSHLSLDARQSFYQHTQTLLQAAGFVPEHYTSLQVATTHGYTLYQRGINLKTDQGLVEISERSPLVRTLIQPYQRAWLIYPREIETALAQAAP